MSFVVDLIAMIFGMPRILFPQIAHEGLRGRTDGGWQVALLFAGPSSRWAPGGRGVLRLRLAWSGRGWRSGVS